MIGFCLASSLAIVDKGILLLLICIIYNNNIILYVCVCDFDHVTYRAN